MSTPRASKAATPSPKLGRRVLRSKRREPAKMERSCRHSRDKASADAPRALGLAAADLSPLLASAQDRDVRKGWRERAYKRARLPLPNLVRRLLSTTAPRSASRARSPAPRRTQTKP